MNCKQGDLAIVVRTHTPGMLGLIVCVVRPHVDGESYRMTDGRVVPTEPSDGKFAWAIERPDRKPMPWIGVQPGMAVQRPFLDAWLRPIRPDAEPAESDLHQPVEVAA